MAEARAAATPSKRHITPHHAGTSATPVQRLKVEPRRGRRPTGSAISTGTTRSSRATGSRRPSSRRSPRRRAKSPSTTRTRQRAVHRAQGPVASEQFVKESRVHGWPSFRDDEVNWITSRAPDGGAVSIDGRHRPQPAGQEREPSPHQPRVGRGPAEGARVSLARLCCTSTPARGERRYGVRRGSRNFQLPIPDRLTPRAAREAQMPMNDDHARFADLGFEPRRRRPLRSAP